MTQVSQFSDLALSTLMLDTLAGIGFTQPTPVQSTAIPLVATGRDLMVQSQTGTGKTAAFAIPIIERLSTAPRRAVSVLGLVPTRELARQVADEFIRLGKNHEIQCAAIYGGASMDKQIAEIRFAHAVIGTPGRVLDHLRRGTLKLDGVRTLVLDEADEMLSMGFARELEQIMAYVPPTRQTLLFSATIPEDIKRYARRYMQAPEFVSLAEQNVAADDVEHHYYIINGVGRGRDLVSVIEYEAPESAIIFTNTKIDSEVVAGHLKRQGYQAEFLNGDLPQRDRESIMARTKEKSLRFLVATDIAARGIDISALSHVINYVLPESPEAYIHRTGRTGRAGHRGTAISLIGPREIGVYYALKRVYKVALQERTVPTFAEIELRRVERRADQFVIDLYRRLGGRPDPDDARRATVLRLLEREDASDIVEALVLMAEQAATQSQASGRSFSGGVLADVPRTGSVAPGGRPQSIAAVAERVAVIQGEFRGRPDSPAPPASKDARSAAPPAVVQEPTPTEVVEDAAVAKAPPRSRGRKSPPAVEAQTPVVETPAVSPKPQAVAPKAQAATPKAPAAEPTARPVVGVRLWMNLGDRDLEKGDSILDVSSELGGLLPADFLAIDVRPRHVYLTLPTAYAHDFIAAVDGERYATKTIRVEVAREND